MEGEELIASMRDKLLCSKTRTLRSISAAISHFKRRDSRVDGPIMTVSTIRPALLSPVHDELPHLQATQREEKYTPLTVLPHAESNLLRSADAEGVNQIARESEAIETLQRVDEPIATVSTIQLTLPRSVHDEPHCSQTTQREKKIPTLPYFSVRKAINGSQRTPRTQNRLRGNLKRSRNFDEILTSPTLKLLSSGRVTKRNRETWKAQKAPPTSQTNHRTRISSGLSKS